MPCLLAKSQRSSASNEYQGSDDRNLSPLTRVLQLFPPRPLASLGMTLLRRMQFSPYLRLDCGLLCLDA
jgi:hypothetical protein